MDATLPTPTARPAVLLVDDEPAFLAAICAGLATDFEIETAKTADQADLMMATRVYDAIVCDHVMPGETGLEFLTRASTRYPRTPRILLTGYMNPELISRSVGVARLAACIVKPVHAAELATAIRAALK